MVFEGTLKNKIAALQTGTLTCNQNVQDFLAKIEKNNKKYNIFLEINQNALKIAKELDKKREKEAKLGKFYGLTFAVKANISVEDLTNSCASKTLEDYKGSFDADVIEIIKQEDGIVLGIVNCDEFASGSSGETSAFGPVINPIAQQRIPGGSSSGSAAAVAADFCDVALGSDTGGSIRNPASHCSVVGVKPSYGRVSRYGLIDLSMSLDQIGPLTKDVWASAYVMSVISGFSANDSVTIDEKVDDYTKFEEKKFKIGIVKEFETLVKDKRIFEIFNKKIELLKEQGHEIKELSLKHINLAIQTYYPIVYIEFFSGTRKFDGLKYGKKIEEVAGDEVLRRILGGKEISRSEHDGAYYKKALKVKELISEELDSAFKKVDFILSPVTPVLPHKFGTKLTPEEMYAYDAFTIPANLAGICAGVVPAGFIKEEDGQIPVGIQLMANKFNEKIMFSGLNLLEKSK